MHTLKHKQMHTLKHTLKHNQIRSLMHMLIPKQSEWRMRRGAILMVPFGLCLCILSALNPVGLFAADVDEEISLFIVNRPIIYGEEAFLSRIADKTGREPVGLVLSGGSARAFAHLGVLKYLEEQGIVPDFIISNSMGSIVGLLYGAGLSPDQIYRLIRTTELGTLFSIQFPLDGGIINPGALTSLIYQYLGDMDLADLPIPVMVICEDLRTKQEVRIASGNLFTIMEAAYALPVYFPPVPYGNPVPYGEHLLIDGGITNLVPLSAAYAYTDTVIASTTFYQNPDLNLKNPLTILNVAMDIGKGRAGVREIEAFNPLLIRCDVEEYSFMEFGRMDDIALAGYRSAEAVREKLAEVDGEGVSASLQAIRDAYEQRLAVVQQRYRHLQIIPPYEAEFFVTGRIESTRSQFDATYLDDSIYLSVGAFGGYGAFSGGISFGGLRTDIQPGIFKAAAKAAFRVTPAYFMEGSFSFRQQLTGSDGTLLLDDSLLTADLAIVPLADETRRVDLPVHAELVFTSDYELEDLYSSVGAAYSQPEDPARGISFSVEAGGYADYSAGFGLYGSGLASFFLPDGWSLHGRVQTRYSLTADSSVPGYRRDYMRSGIPSGDYNRLLTSAVAISWDPVDFRPTFAELLILSGIRLSVYADLLLLDAWYWDGGIQADAELSLIGLKPFPVTAFTGFDSYSDRIRIGFLL